MNAITKGGYQDVPMSRRRAQLLAEYAERLATMLENAPDDKDLAEWVQSKIDRAASSIQSAYHYLDQEDDLEKARAKLYDYRRPSKRINKKTGRREWDYFYTKRHGGRVSSGAFEQGAAFRLTFKGRKGHFHIDHVEGDMIHITHDAHPDKKLKPIHRDELRALLKRQNRREETKHLARKKRAVDKLKRNPTRKRSSLGLALHRLRQAAEKAGVTLPEEYQRKPKKARVKRPKTAIQGQDNFEGFNSAQRTGLNKIVSDLEELQRGKSYSKSRDIGPVSVTTRIEEYISSSFLLDQGLSEEDQKSLRGLVSYSPVSNKVFDQIKERVAEIDLDPETMRSQLETFVSSVVTDTLKILSSEADDRQSKGARLALKRFETPTTKQEQAQHFFDVLGITGFKGRRLSVDGDTARVDIRGKDNKIGFVEFTEQGVNFDSMPELKEDQKEAFNEARENVGRPETETPREDNFDTMPEVESTGTPKRRTLEEAMAHVREQERAREQLTETADEVKGQVTFQEAFDKTNKIYNTLPPPKGRRSKDTRVADTLKQLSDEEFKVLDDYLEEQRNISTTAIDPKTHRFVPTGLTPDPVVNSAIGRAGGAFLRERQRRQDPDRRSHEAVKVAEVNDLFEIGSTASLDNVVTPRQRLPESVYRQVMAAMGRLEIRAQWHPELGAFSTSNVEDRALLESRIRHFLNQDKRAEQALTPRTKAEGARAIHKELERAGFKGARVWVVNEGTDREKARVYIQGASRDGGYLEIKSNREESSFRLKVITEQGLEQATEEQIQEAIDRASSFSIEYNIPRLKPEQYEPFIQGLTNISRRLKGKARALLDPTDSIILPFMLRYTERPLDQVPKNDLERLRDELIELRKRSEGLAQKPTERNTYIIQISSYMINKLNEVLEFQPSTPTTARDQLTSTAQEIITEADQDHDERHDEHQSIEQFELGEHTHTKTGVKLFTAKQKGRTDRDEYRRRVEIAKKHNGRYERRYVKGFLFKTAEDARNFALEVEGGQVEESAETVTPHEDHPQADNFETMVEVESTEPDPSPARQALTETAEEIISEPQTEPSEQASFDTDAIQDAIDNGHELTPVITLQKQFIEKRDAGLLTPALLQESLRIYETMIEGVVEAKIKKKKKGVLLSYIASNINAMTAYHLKSEKKQNAIEEMMSSFLRNVTNTPLMRERRNNVTYNIFDLQDRETDIERIKRLVSEYTEEDAIEDNKRLKAEIEQAKQRQAEKERLLSNPQTAQDFIELKRLRRNKGEDLSAEQHARHNDLVARSRRGKREDEKTKQAPQKTITGGFESFETKHSKTGADLYAVRPAESVGRDEYLRLKAEAKKQGGYYSSYRTVRGFVFPTPEAREQFIQANQQPEAEPQEPVDKQRAKRDALRERLEGYRDSANEALNADRRTNTARRARFARYATEDAFRRIEYVNRGQRILNAIDEGRAYHLQNISNATDLDMLQSIVNRAKSDDLSSRGLPWSEYEKEQDRLKNTPIEQSALEGRDLYPDKLMLHPSDLKSLKKYLTRSDGTARRGARTALAELNAMLSEPKEKRHVVSMDTLMRVLAHVPPEADKSFGVLGRVVELKRDHDRMKRLGIENEIDLKAVLREYEDIVYQRSAEDEKAHREAEEAKAERDRLIRRGEFARMNIPSYFPTPTSVIDRMIEIAGIEEGETVLEPSAGAGHILEKLADTQASVKAIETNYTLRNYLEDQGHEVVGNDALEHSDTYDHVIMNPPFEKQADIEHVTHAFENNLVDGGRLVAVMSASAMTRDNKKARDFQDLVNKYGHYERLPEGTFKDSDRQTGVNTILVVLDLPDSGLKKSFYETLHLTNYRSDLYRTIERLAS